MTPPVEALAVHRITALIRAGYVVDRVQPCSDSVGLTFPDPQQKYRTATVLDSGTAILHASGGEQARFPFDADPSSFARALSAVPKPRPRFEHYRTNVIAFWVLFYPAIFWFTEHAWAVLKKAFS
ncbi:hypothetical protein [Stenotrophomonas maltophilia]|uniref:Uncharacterized protein n=1 Tax=Stenotrophomonas maltophilia TaxID=40324 RepID=A0A4V6RDL1_STEMA|nr:hypothetical protein [Stenotrophomonas maltophilia]TGY35230.1 hypothetical protein E5352_05785 [Stenotrophomonas maltophilia]